MRRGKTSERASARLQSPSCLVENRRAGLVSLSAGRATVPVWRAETLFTFGFGCRFRERILFFNVRARPKRFPDLSVCVKKDRGNI